MPSTGARFQGEHLSADGYPVEIGARFWNNDLRVTEVTEVGDRSDDYADTGCKQTWHRTTHGSFDTMSGFMRQYGRLARYFEGLCAEDYEPGTQFGDVKR